jgi:pimeloyl-ACP methyl ester carboxylesterase
MTIRYLDMASLNEQLVLPDGRKLCWAEYGHPDGLPVFYFHGCPSSRLEPGMFGDQLSSTGLRIIAPDRPGIGLSDFQPSRSFEDWVNDIVHLADHLAWPTFALLGNSGGGPYVVACAALIPERVTVAAVVSGGWRMDAPEVKANLPFVNRLFWMFARSFTPGLRLMLTAMRKSGSSAKSDSAASDSPSADDLKKLRSMLPPPDVAALSVPGRMRATSAATTEALRNGTKGVEWDARMYVHPFDFEHTSICVPVRTFHGGLDRNVPLALVRAYTAEIPGATLTVWPDDGHLSAPCNHLSEIVEALKS